MLAEPKLMCGDAPDAKTLSAVKVSLMIMP